MQIVHPAAAGSVFQRGVVERKRAGHTPLGIGCAQVLRDRDIQIHLAGYRLDA